MYEPETISEYNENKKYILAGYDDIPEEKDIENNSEKNVSNKSITKENYNYNNNYDNEEVIPSENKMINIQNIKKPKNKFDLNNKNKNTFFDEYNNQNKNKMKTLNLSTSLKKNIKNCYNINPQNTKIKIDKKKIRNNFISKAKNEDMNNKKKEFTNNILEDYIEKDEVNDKQEINNEDKDNNNANSLSFNSIKDNYSTERNETNESLKNKKISYKKSYRDSLAQNNMQLREINIRFILTKEEYAILMKEKAKNQDFFS